MSGQSRVAEPRRRMPTSPTVIELGNGRYEVVSGDRRRLAYAVRRGAETWVWLEGVVYVLDRSGASVVPRHRGDDAGALAAPMPATVAAIRVELGQAVRAGDVLVTLEAMKMEMTVAAPRDGRVRTISCRVGELVQPGIPLVELE